MRLDGRPRLLIPALAVALLGGPAARAADSPPDYRKMFVKVAKYTAPATLGTYAHPKPDGTCECVSAVYPLKHTSTVKLRPGGKVQLLLGAGASDLSWRAVRVNGKGEEKLVAFGEARAITKTFKRWELKLPAKLSRSVDLLGFNVSYPFAFSDFEIAAKVLKK